MNNRADKQDRCFAILEAAAIKGERCPVAQDLENQNINGSTTGFLVRKGRIRVEVYAKNWRVVEIMEGPNKGACTAEPPWGGEPYRVAYRDEVSFPKRYRDKVKPARRAARAKAAGTTADTPMSDWQAAGRGAGPKQPPAPVDAAARQSIGLAAIDSAADYEVRAEAHRRGVQVGTIVAEIFAFGVEVYRDEFGDEGSVL